MKFIKNKLVLATLILCLLATYIALPARATAVEAAADYNYINNGDFENPDYNFSGQNFGRWYAYGARASVDGDICHAGNFSAKVTESSKGSGIAYRLPTNATYDGWIYGIMHSLSVWVNACAEMDVTIKVELTVWTGANHKNGFYLTKTQSLEKSVWQEINLPFKIEKNDGKLMLIGSDDSVETEVGMLSAVDIFVLSESNDTFNIDDASLSPDIENVDKGFEVLPSNGENADIQGTGALADSGFELGAFATSYSETQWSPSGAFTKLTSVTDFTCAGQRAMEISGRTTNESSALIRMSMAGYFVDGKKYNFKAQVSSVLQTDVVFKVRVYGYDGKDYPDVYAPIAQVTTKSGEWSEMSGWLTVHYEAGDKRIEIKTEMGVFYIDNVSGVSCLEFYFCTAKDSQNATTTLYVDNCYLSLLSKTVVPTEYEVEREGKTQGGVPPTFTTKTYKTEVEGISLKALGISVLTAIVGYFIFSVVYKTYKKRMREIDNE